MTEAGRRARVEALAKINLGLKVLHRRPDGYHELRTVYQTISLADAIDVEFSPARRTSVEVASDADIPDNIVLRAAHLALEAMRVAARVRFQLHKRIPMGAGLGGGSSDAAAVLLALPALARKPVPLARLLAIAAELGSDVPFFLTGGTALGTGRGEEVYPLPDAPPRRGLLVAPPVHVSTAEAYRSLARRLTTGGPRNIISIFQSWVWRETTGVAGQPAPQFAGNDFEEAVFRRHPRLRSIKNALLRHGAEPAALTGSGAAVYGVFRSREELGQALPFFQKERVVPFVFVSRARYRARWWRMLREFVDGGIWPPKNRDER